MCRDLLLGRTPKDYDVAADVRARRAAADLSWARVKWASLFGVVLVVDGELFLSRSPLFAATSPIPMVAALTASRFESDPRKRRFAPGFHH